MSAALPSASAPDFSALATDIKLWGRELGFQQVGITDLDVSEHAAHLHAWLAEHYHGEMQYMERHEALRADPATLVPGALRVISVRMDYLPAEPRALSVLQNSSQAYIARYALG